MPHWASSAFIFHSQRQTGFRWDCHGSIEYPRSTDKFNPIGIDGQISRLG